MTLSEIPIHVAGQWIVKFVIATDIPKISLSKKTSVAEILLNLALALAPDSSTSQ